MTLQSVRIIALIVLFLATFIVGIVPLYVLKIWSKRKASKLFIVSNVSSNEKIEKNKISLSSNFYIQVLLQFGGGVLFATIFVHLIPEVKESYETYSQRNDSIFKNNENGENHRIPYVELAICSGFFLIFLIEEIMHSFLDNYFENRKKYCNNKNIIEERPSGCSVGMDSSFKRKDSRKSLSSVFVNYGADLLTEPTIKCSQDNDSIHISTISANCISNTLQNKGNENIDNFEEPVLVLFLRGLVIISAFSIHSIFDGLSIGLQNTTSDTWSMFFAITTHKLVISFVVSLELYQQSKRLVIVAFHMALFAIMSPIGILIVIISEGSFLGTQNENNPIVILLTSMASGILLYIVFLEILQKNRCNALSGIIQLISIFVGFCIMIAVNLLLSE